MNWNRCRFVLVFANSAVKTDAVQKDFLPAFDVGLQEEVRLGTHIMLANFTDQGIRNIKDTAKRADAFKELAEFMGASVKDIYWTLGQYDVIALIEAPDEMTVTALELALGKSGNLRTQTLRAFSQ